MKNGTRPPNTPTRPTPQLKPVGMSTRSKRQGLGPTPKRDHSLRIMMAFLLLVTIAITSLFYLSSRKPIELQHAMTKFSRLHEVYQQEGMQKFIEAKEALKQDISHVIDTSEDETVQNDATNVAVYLFPEVLSKNDFERPVALDDWAPLEAAIEKAPKTPQSRVLFEELRANIWNYENPEHTRPNLSATAKEVIRIYEELSAP